MAGSIASYSDLVAKVAKWLDRDDLTPQIPDFLALLEARINRLLRTVNQEKRATWAVASSIFPLPDDFRQMRSLGVLGTPNRPLDQISPVDTAGKFPGGPPSAYWVEGRTLIIVPGISDPISLTALYYTRLPALTADAPTNWLLDEHPDIYLWGTLQQAATYIRDPDAIETCKAYLDDAIAELQRESRLDRWGNGPITAPSPRQVRGARC